MSKSSPAVPGVVSLPCAALLLLILAPAIHGAPATKTAKAPRPPQPFDTTLDHIPSGFAGNDFMAIFKASTAPKKGEFETSDQYRQRLMTLRGEHYYAFKYQTLLKYDADRQGFSVMVFGDRLKGDAALLPGNTRAIIVGESSKIVGHYIGSNAYGAKVAVSRKVGQELAVAVSGAFMLPSDALGSGTK
jgi:hypothetical protein